MTEIRFENLYQDKSVYKRMMSYWDERMDKILSHTNISERYERTDDGSTIYYEFRKKKCFVTIDIVDPADVDVDAFRKNEIPTNYFITGCIKKVEGFYEEGSMTTILDIALVLCDTNIKKAKNLIQSFLINGGKDNQETQRLLNDIYAKHYRG